MYFRLKTLLDYILITKDGHTAGIIESVLFDEGVFGVQYVVLHTNDWLHDRLVLLSPFVLSKPDQDTMHIPVQCSKQLIASAPGIDVHAPVSRRHQHAMAEHFGWPIPWTGVSGNVPGVMTPPRLPVEPIEAEFKGHGDDLSDYALYHSSEVRGYRVMVEGREIGHVEEFIVEIPAWMMRWIVVKEGGMRSGRKLIMVHYVDSVDYDASALFLNLSETQYRNCPEFDDEDPIGDDQQQQLTEEWRKRAFPSESAQQQRNNQ